MKGMTFIHHIFFALAMALGSAQAQSPVSGYDYLVPEMQEIQTGDFGNPGKITVDAGEKLFSTIGANGKSCTSCHSEGGSGLEIETPGIRY